MPFNFSSPEYLSHHRTRKNRVSPVNRASPAHMNSPLVILSYATVCLHPSVSLNNEKYCREFSEHKIAVREKTAGLRSGNSSDLNSACLKALVPVEIFQFSSVMHYETE